ncbi:hypothetical protein P5V15_011788 [Pogonomyrmex californicus]
MAKSEMNNEFVLLRHAVRQARICTINKVIKVAKLLRDKHGNETQLEKNKKKADKLIDEVYALKKIKDDEISRFGIFNERSLTEILQDLSSTANVRIMARVTHYAALNRRLKQFKERFPDCKKQLAEKKKKTTKLKDKKSKEIKSSEKQKANLDKNIEQSQHDSTDEKPHILFKTKKNLRKRESLDEDDMPLAKRKLMKLQKNDTSKNTVTDKQSSVIKPCSVTIEATVKRFTEFLKEEEVPQDTQMSVVNQNLAGTTTEQVKMVDDFFITEDNEDCQGNSTSASTSYARFPKYNTRASTSYTRSPTYNTRAKAFQLNDRNKNRNTSHKNNTKFNTKNPGKRSFPMKSNKMISNKINKSTKKNNINENTIANKKDEDISLHPSWLAKKKEQEIMSQGFQGKKIIFKDD